MTYNCTLCAKNPITAKQRRCAEPNFKVMKPRRIDESSGEYSFCPGKATWYEDIVETYEQCRVALETGILPKEGHLTNQPELFVEVFPLFVQRWREKQYSRFWKDVAGFANAIFSKTKSSDKPPGR